VKELSGGDLRIDVVFEWGIFSPDAEQQTVLDVAAGKADLTAAGPRVFDTLGVKSFQAMTAPMLIDSYPLEDAVVKSDIPGQMLGGLGKLNVTGLGVLGGSLNKPIAVAKPLLGPADWPGITFESYRSQTQAQAIRILGAQPTDVFGPALDEGLDNGQIQGYSKGLLVYRVNAREDLAPYVTANVNLWPGMQVLLANPSGLAQLTDEQRGWLQQAAAGAAARSTSLIDQEDQIVADICQAGARLANASAAQLTALRLAFAPVYSSLEQDLQTKSFIAHIEALKQSTGAGPPLAIPPGCTGPAPGSVSVGPTSNDPLAGTWTTAKLTESQIVRAFIAAGGTEKEGHQVFSGVENMGFAVITIVFEDGDFSGNYDHRTYVLGDHGTVTLHDNTPDCIGGVRYRYDLKDDTLRFHVVRQCSGGDGPYNTTFYASFPFTRSA
jgi:TRAP-type C4-dicarboxylate transport system substrate-binding protein